MSRILTRIAHGTIISLPILISAGDENKGSFVAVGTFLPGIEIWNLDVIDVLEPVCTLGGYDLDSGSSSAAASSSSSGKKKASKSGKAAKPAEPETLPGSHRDAVLCLGWNQNARCETRVCISFSLWFHMLVN
jgi:periodic tryptophan protein 1